MTVDVQCPACSRADVLATQELLLAYDVAAGGLEGASVAWVCRHCSTLASSSVSWWLLQGLFAHAAGVIDSGPAQGRAA